MLDMLRQLVIPVQRRQTWSVHTHVHMHGDTEIDYSLPLHSPVLKSSSRSQCHTIVIRVDVSFHGAAEIPYCSFCNSWLMLSKFNRMLEGKYSNMEAICLELTEDFFFKFAVVA